MGPALCKPGSRAGDGEESDGGGDTPPAEVNWDAPKILSINVVDAKQAAVGVPRRVVVDVVEEGKTGRVRPRKVGVGWYEHVVDGDTNLTLNLRVFQGFGFTLAGTASLCVPYRKLLKLIPSSATLTLPVIAQGGSGGGDGGAALGQTQTVTFDQAVKISAKVGRGQGGSNAGDPSAAAASADESALLVGPTVTFTVRAALALQHPHALRACAGYDVSAALASLAELLDTPTPLKAAPSLAALGLRNSFPPIDGFEISAIGVRVVALAPAKGKGKDKGKKAGKNAAPTARYLPARSHVVRRVLFRVGGALVQDFDDAPPPPSSGGEPGEPTDPADTNFAKSISSHPVRTVKTGGYPKVDAPPGAQHASMSMSMSRLNMNASVMSPLLPTGDPEPASTVLRYPVAWPPAADAPSSSNSPPAITVAVKVTIESSNAAADAAPHGPFNAEGAELAVSEGGDSDDSDEDAAEGKKKKGKKDGKDKKKKKKKKKKANDDDDDDATTENAEEGIDPEEFTKVRYALLRLDAAMLCSAVYAPAKIALPLLSKEDYVEEMKNKDASPGFASLRAHDDAADATKKDMSDDDDEDTTLTGKKKDKKGKKEKDKKGKKGGADDEARKQDVGASSDDEAVSTDGDSGKKKKAKKGKKDKKEKKPADADAKKKEKKAKKKEEDAKDDGNAEGDDGSTRGWAVGRYWKDETKTEGVQQWLYVMVRGSWKSLYDTKYRGGVGNASASASLGAMLTTPTAAAAAAAAAPAAKDGDLDDDEDTESPLAAAAPGGAGGDTAAAPPSKPTGVVFKDSIQRISTDTTAPDDGPALMGVNDDAAAIAAAVEESITESVEAKPGGVEEKKPSPDAAAHAATHDILSGLNAPAPLRDPPSVADTLDRVVTAVAQHPPTPAGAATPMTDTEARVRIARFFTAVGKPGKDPVSYLIAAKGRERELLQLLRTKFPEQAEMVAFLEHYRVGAAEEAATAAAAAEHDMVHMPPAPAPSPALPAPTASARGDGPIDDDPLLRPQPRSRASDASAFVSPAEPTVRSAAAPASMATSGAASSADTLDYHVDRMLFGARVVNGSVPKQQQQQHASLKQAAVKALAEFFAAIGKPGKNARRFLEAAAGREVELYAKLADLHSAEAARLAPLARYAGCPAVADGGVNPLSEASAGAGRSATDSQQPLPPVMRNHSGHHVGRGSERLAPGEAMMSAAGSASLAAPSADPFPHPPRSGPRSAGSRANDTGTRRVVSGGAPLLSQSRLRANDGDDDDPLSAAPISIPATRSIPPTHSVSGSSRVLRSGGGSRGALPPPAAMTIDERLRAAAAAADVDAAFDSDADVDVDVQTSPSPAPSPAPASPQPFVPPPSARSVSCSPSTRGVGVGFDNEVSDGGLHTRMVPPPSSGAHTQQHPPARRDEDDRFDRLERELKRFTGTCARLINYQMAREQRRRHEGGSESPAGTRRGVSMSHASLQRSNGGYSLPSQSISPSRAVLMSPPDREVDDSPPAAATATASPSHLVPSVHAGDTLVPPPAWASPHAIPPAAVAVRPDQKVSFNPHIPHTALSAATASASLAPSAAPTLSPGYTQLDVPPGTPASPAPPYFEISPTPVGIGQFAATPTPTPGPQYLRAHPAHSPETPTTRAAVAAELGNVSPALTTTPGGGGGGSGIKERVLHGVVELKGGVVASSVSVQTRNQRTVVYGGSPVGAGAP